MAACAGFPWNVTSHLVLASVGMLASFRKYGWIIMAASTPSNTPASSSRIFPPPPSSAGVPMTVKVPGRSAINGARANAAPAPIVAMTL